MKNDDKKYKRPLAILVLSITAIVAMIIVRFSFDIPNDRIDKMVNVGMVLACAVPINAILRSIDQLADSCYDRRMAKKAKQIKTSSECEKKTLDDIKKLVESNDIIEIVAIKDSKTITMGASSQVKRGTSEFFDKAYYIEKREYLRIDYFLVALEIVFDGNYVDVYSIDGIVLKK